MKIGIDARFYGLTHAGLGRYTKNLIQELEKLDSSHDYYVLLQQSNWEEYQPQNKQFHKVLLDSHPYSLKSQLVDWMKLKKLQLDLIHFTHFSYPILYSGKFVVTVHDLIKSDFYDKGSSTRSLLIYKLKHWGYSFILRQALTKSEKVITPTNFVKQELLRNYLLPEDKIIPVYEGAEGTFSSKQKVASSKKILEKYTLESEKYLMYVGNVYPYKNVPKLLEVLARIDTNKNEYKQIAHLRLAIVCSRSVFYDKLQQQIKEQDLTKRVLMLGFVPDEELAVLYANALAYITATLAEGFGITGLEAMQAGCPVLASDRSCLPEVYGEAAMYFDPDNIDEIINQIKRITNQELRIRKIKEGEKQVAKYSWEEMAVEIQEVYTSCSNSK